MPQRFCAVCGRLSGNQSRCAAHKIKRADRKSTTNDYSGAWRRQSEKTRAEWVEAHGEVCPGWNKSAHPSKDLVVDHDVGVLCRACNGRKAATHDKQRKQAGRR